MAAGSDKASWAWAGDTRHCDTCRNELRIKDVGLFHDDGKGTRTIRCQGCVEVKRDAFVAKTRLEMGLAA